MKYDYSEKKEVLSSDVAKGYLLAMTDHLDIVELEIYKDGLVPAHSLPIDVTFYVISGVGELTIGDEPYLGAKGDVLTVKKDLNREWKNTSAVILNLSLIKQKTQ